MAVTHKKLEQMVLEHVAQAAGLFVIPRAVAHAEALGHGDLDVVHERSVPHGLEQDVGEAQHEDVLDRFLAEVMVDAVGLFLVEHAPQLARQGLGRGAVAPERFLDDQARPAAAPFPFLVEVGLAEALDHLFVERRRQREVHQSVAPGVPTFCPIGPAGRTGPRSRRGWS
jgi:hypothetical protein